VAFTYPLMLDVSDRLIVIIGGGSVAARKATGLLEAGATRVQVVAPEPSPDLPEGVELIRDSYRPEHLDGASLVFAATDEPDVNAQVVRDAHARKLLVSRADATEEDAGDFTTPAKFTQGPVIVAVSAGGNPALAATIRAGLAWRFDKRWAVMAEAMQQLRPQIMSNQNLTPAQRTAIFRNLAGEDALYLLARDGTDALLAWLVERHPEFA
jgi:precorrin-2 dehydrogenase/sirohydrochlorin ferrochelatase